MARTLVWKVLSGTYDLAANWDDTTTPADPATAPPDATDTAEIEGSGGTVAGNGTAATLQFLGGPWVTTGALSVTELAVAGTLTVDGTILASHIITVGENTGGPGAVTVQGGASLKVTAAAETTYYAVELGYKGTGSLDLEGAGTILDTNGSGMRVGDYGAGSLVVAGGAAVSAGSSDSNLLTGLSVGQLTGSSGAITVTGSGSSLRTVGSVRIGRGGTGTLLVESAGSVAGGDAADSFGIGDGNPTVSGATGGTGSATITGAGSKLLAASTLVVGSNQSTGVLTVTNGGVVEATTRIIVGSGNAASVAGAGTLIVGPGGTAMSDGPHVMGQSSIVFGGVQGAVGVGSVSGAGALLDTGGDPLSVGPNGTGKLTVAAGGLVKAGTQYAADGAFNIAGTATGTGSVTVTGAGSEIISAGQLNVGYAGVGSLLVQAAAEVDSGNIASLSANQGFTIGTTTGSTGNTTVTGAGTKLVNVGRFAIGGQAASTGGGQGTLTIANGATVSTSLATGATADGADIGAIAGGTGSVTLTGTGSMLSIASNLVLGTAGIGTIAVGTGATVSASSAEVGGNGMVNLVGGTFDPLDAITVDAGGTISGSGTVDATVDNNGTVIAQGGTMTITGPVSGGGTLDVGHNGTMALESSVAAAQSVAFTDATGDLVLDDLAGFHATISNFGVGDILTLEGITVGSSTYSGNVLTLFDPSHTELGTIAFAGSYLTSVNVPPGPSPISITTSDTPPCFLRGTLILTDRGEVAVEALREGDRVALGGGGFRPIAWIGHRRCDTATHPAPETLTPIRILRDAFGPNRPARDLWLSPAHAVFADGVLIPVDRLVNGATVAPDPGITRPHYFHVELDRHDVMLAEGLSVESYLDTGNRSTFENAGLPVMLHPDFATPTRDHGCAPFRLDGAAVTAVKQALLDRASGLGFTLAANDSDIALRTASGLIRPVAHTGNVLRFVVPQDTGAVRLLSETMIPAEIAAGSADRRRVGVRVSRITVRDAEGLRDIALDDPALKAGWHGAEQDGRTVWRWTDGDATLPIAGPCLLTITLVDRPRRWERDARNAEAVAEAQRVA